MARMRTAESRHPQLSQKFIDAHKRIRLAGAVASGAHREGLRAQTVNALTKQVRIGRGTFYELFSSRAACVEFACQAATGVLVQALEGVADGGGSRDERAERTVDALIDAAGAEPLLAELCLVHSPTAELAYPHRFRQAVVEATWQALGGDRMAELAAMAIVTLVEMQLARGAAARLGDSREGLIGIARG
jgi:AcrR family transcriptional regulator